MRHLYSDFVFCKNNFFNDPESVVELANSLSFDNTSRLFPGRRTIDLALSDDPVHQDFVKIFVDKLITEVYTNIRHLRISVSFHKYPRYENQQLNTGWTHIDHEMLAGVVYLNKNAEDFTAGTSLYTTPTDIPMPGIIREEFNIDPNTVDTEKYITELTTYNSQFKETIQIGNMYNRLITYDANMFHKPNNYAIDHPDDRLALIFVIQSYNGFNRQYKIENNPQRLQ